MVHADRGIKELTRSIRIAAISLFRLVFAQALFCSTLIADSPKTKLEMKAESLPWYMRETAPDARGRLTFLSKPWWPRARSLAEGQSFTLDLNGDGRPDTVVERLDGNIIEAIDDTGHAANILNQTNTAYLISYHATGIVDRMVAYIDADGDGKADEMEVRYYQNGYLRFGWFGENYDHDGSQIFDLKNWQYSGDGFPSRFRGNTLMYLNKYDAVNQSWVPLAECPFAFWDPSHDGSAEIVLRVSAVPRQGIDGEDLDYANNPAHRWESSSPNANDVVMANLRLSFSLDPEPRGRTPHFTFGFTMVGATPYTSEGMLYSNPRRRPPQTVVRLPWSTALDTALHYDAKETGFTWDEGHEQNRWEGQFWIWERTLLKNTGNPVYRWNMRREYSPHRSTTRQLYYSEVDKRYHLWGATEGWLEVSHEVGDTKDLEIRAYDSKGDGYFDTWEVFVAGNPIPARTTRVLDSSVQSVPLDTKFLDADYNGRVLPRAIADDQELIATMKAFVSSALAHRYEEKAAKAGSQEAKRYLLDVARELYFLKLRDALYLADAANVYPSRDQMMTDSPGYEDPPLPLPMREVFLRSLKLFWHPRNLLHVGHGMLANYTAGDSVEYWRLADQIQKFVTDYGDGKLHVAAEDLKQMDPHVLPEPHTSLLQWIVGCTVFVVAGVALLFIVKPIVVRKFLRNDSDCRVPV